MATRKPVQSVFLAHSFSWPHSSVGDEVGKVGDARLFKVVAGEDLLVTVLRASRDHPRSVVKHDRPVDLPIAGAANGKSHLIYKERIVLCEPRSVPTGGKGRARDPAPSLQ